MATNQNRPAWQDQALFERFEAHLFKHRRILDLGCGHGKPIAKRLAGKQHHIIGVDRSHTLIRIAWQILPNHQSL